MKASNCVGVGTTVRVYLPEAAAESLETVAAVPAGPEGKFGDACVLLVEDDPAVREFMNVALTSAGFLVDIATSGEEAPELLNQRVPDLLVTDVVMPGMRGSELAKLVRERHTKLPVLFVSGYADPELDEWIEKSDSKVRFLAKPFRPTELLHQVKSLLLEGR